MLFRSANSAVLALKGAEEGRRRLAAEQIFLLALMNYKQLSPEESETFAANNAALLSEYLKN